MTRAKDTLAIYANQGQSKKDPKPTKFLREFMLLSAYKQFWTTHSAAAVQDSLFAEEEQRIALQQSNVAGWLLMPPMAGFMSSVRCASSWRGNGTCRGMCRRRCTMEKRCMRSCVRFMTRNALGARSATRI